MFTFSSCPTHPVCRPQKRQRVLPIAAEFIFNSHVRVRTPAIAADDLYRGMLAEPDGQRLRRAIGQEVEHLLRLRFTRIVPSVRPLRRAQSSTPNTRTGPAAGTGAARTSRNSVRRLTGIPAAVAWRAPGAPPKSKPVRWSPSR